MRRSIRARRLHRRRLIVDGQTVRRATLFPFFDGRGHSSLVLVVDAHSAILRTFRADTSRLRIPLWGPLLLSGALQELDEFLLAELADLWHYDPWWLLADDRFLGDPAIPVLKATNCVERFMREPADLLYRSDLTRVTKVRYPVPSETYQHKKFDPSMLPPRETARRDTIAAETETWILDPIWQ